MTGSVIAILQVIIANLPGAIDTAEKLYALGEKLLSVVKGSAPTPDEIAQLRAQITTDVIESLAPLPPAQPGDPDYVAPTA